MIPRIAHLPQADSAYLKFLDALEKTSFAGDIERSYSARLLCATDNSVYQRMPSAVVFPRSKHDVVTLFKLAQQNEFQKVKFAVRGGGTGTNGQSLSSGLIIDMSRHMKNVSDLNIDEHSVYVEPGVIKDELNELLAPHNLFFSPELSTSNRATVGGMISNDAAGQGSLKYGRTSEHVLATEVVLIDGTLTTFQAVAEQDLPLYFDKPGLEGQIYQSVHALLKGNASQVAKIFPKLNRFMTGYDFAHAYNPKTKVLDLARLVCGAEGTLCTIVGAKLDLTVKPNFRALCVIKYANFDAALRHANILIKAGAFSVETVDSKVLNLAKNDPVWLTVQDYIQDVPNVAIDGVNIVEFCGYDQDTEAKLMDKLYADTLKKAQKQSDGILGAQLATTKEAISAVYGMRKKAVGLLGSLASQKKLVAFTEDTVVPPEQLADYILEFRALLDSMNVEYGMFGHVDTGLMHVRPALDLTLDSDKEKLVAISHGVVELLKKYGGQMWGEHGRGYRSCYGEVFFKELYTDARKLKAIFDPLNRLNPGKICIPFGNETDSLVALDDPMRGDLDRLIEPKVREHFIGALNCNGNGQCFSYQKASLMCPSYRYTKDHVKSPKGYAALMREWLQKMSERGYDAQQLEHELLYGKTEQEGTVQSALSKDTKAKQENAISLTSLISTKIVEFAQYSTTLVKRTYNTIFEHDDFNHEYLEHIKTCVSCKSCKTQCPAHVNAAELNSRFLNFYYSRYLRPSMDLMCLHAESVLPILAYFPKLSNLFIQSKLNQAVVKQCFKFVDLPKFSEQNLYSAAKEAQFLVLSAHEAKIRALHFDALIVTDSFTASYDVKNLIELAQVMRFLGFRVAFLKPYTNGKVLVIRGARAKFIKEATKQALRLSDIYQKGVKLVGFDPALTICYRDEYQNLIPNCPEFKVELPEEWLKEALSSETFAKRKVKLAEALSSVLKQDKAYETSNESCPEVEAKLTLRGQGSVACAQHNLSKDFYLFCHCTEQALVPLSVRMWQEVLAQFNLRLIPVPVACCGMAGLFGHMLDRLEESKQIYLQNWQGELQKREFAQCLVTGFSCRSQVERMEGQEANHPIHVLYDLLSRAHQKL